jgi:cytochrome c oxidase subunit 2
MKRFLASLAIPALVCAAGEAFAAQPQDWQLGFQPAATPIMRTIEWFNAYTLWFIVPITLLVMVLLAVCIFRFRASRNPVPSRTSHNTLIEVIWTVGPVVVLLFIAVPSFQLLTAQYTPPEEPQLTVKATGNQWYWTYDYEVKDPVSFTSLILADADREKAGKTDIAAYPRLLAVDNELVVPVDTTIRVQVTGADVIHSFAMPAFGIKVDGVPGRLEETWFKATKEGLYYGQCSELCGKDHAFMPISNRVVSK